MVLTEEGVELAVARNAFYRKRHFGYVRSFRYVQHLGLVQP